MLNRILLFLALLAPLSAAAQDLSAVGEQDEEDGTICIESGNMFESGSLDASQDRARVETCVAQFMSLVGLCEALNQPAR